jgi:hypothetical protein
VWTDASHNGTAVFHYIEQPISSLPVLACVAISRIGQGESDVQPILLLVVEPDRQPVRMFGRIVVPRLLSFVAYRGCKLFKESENALLKLVSTLFVQVCVAH